MNRTAGILLPISSLPSKYGIGCFSESAYAFVDWLKEAGQCYWQILPLVPTSYGDSPYQSFSTYAGNPYFIDLEALVQEEVLTKEECDAVDFGEDAKDIDYEKMYNGRYKLLRKAYERSNVSRNWEYNQFVYPLNMPDGQYSIDEAHEKGRLIITYTLNNLKKQKYSEDIPPINMTAPQIHILGHFTDATALYRYLYKYIPTDDPGEQIVAQKALEITSECQNDKEKINAINEFIHQNIQYLAVEHGEFGHRPDLASEVLRKRFGDCKGSALLTRNMLRAVGIDARLVWIGTRETGSDWTEMPNISSGNHMIAAVVLPSDSIIFLDGTARFSTPERIPFSISGRQALIEDTPDSCIIKRVPPSLPQHNIREEQLTMTLDDNNLSMQGTVTLSGESYRLIRVADNDIPQALRQDFYGHIFSNNTPGVIPSNIKYDMGPDSLIISGSATIPGAVKDAGATIYIDTKIASRLNDIKFDLIGRTTGGRLGFPATIKCKVTIPIPDGLTPGRLYPDFSIDNNWISGNVTDSTDSEKRSITRTMTLIIKEPYVMFNNIKEYDTELTRFIKACSSLIALNKL